MARRLEAAGFTRLDERDRWELSPGACRYVVRDGGSIAAFRVGSAPPSASGFRLIGAHTDSPTFRVRPVADVQRHGHRLIGVEPYGSALWHTWLDRDLTVAGRVAVAEGSEVAMRLVRLAGAPLRIPSLAIHLNREVNEQGLRLDPQRHIVPLWDDRDGVGLTGALATELGVDEDAVLGHDLVLADTQRPALGGQHEQWLFAPRLDNLVSCHAGLRALADTETTAHTQVLVANDHEEVGSRSAEGAAGPFLEDTLRRIAAACGDTDPQGFAMATTRSRFVSADAAHAVHPNYSDRHETEHRPRLGGGPVLKTNANQAYATDAGSGAWLTRGARAAGVTLQHFVTRADLPCGSTIGPLTAARLGIATVDVGIPLLSMHSVREQGAVDDTEPFVAVLRVHLEHPEPK